ncbi:hypothetical protein PCANC_07343 [Puccinia coronata f. sp. avenae]|uniref:Uncharacterized protein n=1 Tax=Puccinia coronata f. sp. avenae TaxID=200324 RepID=A0A2N5T6E1_9BASI|nr:hypothetical protein PCANC_07343 [Puccinia coronata f. sp. avenae]PLW28546.1 hypothetical protein PCASD_18180 [Puccinia coronata f. sp. avenae]
MKTACFRPTSLRYICSSAGRQNSLLIVDLVRRYNAQSMISFGETSTRLPAVERQTARAEEKPWPDCADRTAQTDKSEPDALCHRHAKTNATKASRMRSSGRRGAVIEAARRRSLSGNCESTI